MEAAGCMQDGVVPMDDDDEDEEEEEEYLDDEASEDNWADGDTMEPFSWEAGPPPAARGHWANMQLQDGLLDGLPPLPSMRVDFGRLPGGRRMQGLRTNAAPAAAAGVWDDMGDGMDGLPDPMMLTGKGNCCHDWVKLMVCCCFNQFPGSMTSTAVAWSDRLAAR